MKQKGMMMSISIGLDIAKDKIDIFADGKHTQIVNTKNGIVTPGQDRLIDKRSTN